MKKKINKEATVRNIRAKAEGNIRDIDAFNKLMENEQDILDSAILWEAEVVYE
jgi:23S rRNA U2552 (ribose-2'-O)-methylase RlmE/FtsJ